MHACRLTGTAETRAQREMHKPKPLTLNPKSLQANQDTGIEEVYRHGARLLAHGARAHTRRHMERTHTHTE